MKTLAALIILAAAPGFAAAQATKEDLKKLAKAGVSEDVILAYIKANGLASKPTSDDLVELKEAGLSDKLLAGILTPSEATPSTVYVERPSGYATGYLSVNPSYAYTSSYYTPTYVRYYTGSFSRPYYSYSSYCRPYYGGSYYRSSYCGPRVSLSYSGSRHCGRGFSARVRW